MGKEGAARRTLESRGRKRKGDCFHGMMGTVPTPIVTMTTCAQNALEIMGGPPAGVTGRRGLLLES